MTQELLDRIKELLTGIETTAEHYCGWSHGAIEVPLDEAVDLILEQKEFLDAEETKPVIPQKTADLIGFAGLYFRVCRDYDSLDEEQRDNLRVHTEEFFYRARKYNIQTEDVLLYKIGLNYLGFKLATESWKAPFAGELKFKLEALNRIGSKDNPPRTYTLPDEVASMPCCRT